MAMLFHEAAIEWYATVYRGPWQFTGTRREYTPAELLGQRVWRAFRLFNGDAA